METQTCKQHYTVEGPIKVRRSFDLFHYGCYYRLRCGEIAGPAIFNSFSGLWVLMLHEATELIYDDTGKWEGEDGAHLFDVVEEIYVQPGNEYLH